MKTTVIFAVMIMLVMPFVLAKAIGTMNMYYPPQSVQQPVQRDNTATLPRWNSTGDYSYASWHGLKPNPITAQMTTSPIWGPRILTTRAGNTTQYSYVARTLPAVTGVTYRTQCNRGETKCGGKIFSKCEGGGWMIAQTCSRGQECTSMGCKYA